MNIENSYLKPVTYTEPSERFKMESFCKNNQKL